jgi:hypothetical protein
MTLQGEAQRNPGWLYKIKRPALKELQNGTTKDARLLAASFWRSFRAHPN